MTAAAVRDAVVRVLEPLEQLDAFISGVAGRGGQPAEAFHFSDVAEHMDGGGVPRSHEQVGEAAHQLGALLDRLGGWWAADRPPDFCPRSASVAEAVLRAALGTLAGFDVTGTLDGASLLARCQYADLRRPRPDFDSVAAALRCEIVAMSRRPPPGTDGQRLLTGELNWWPHSDDMSQDAWTAALDGLPTGWLKLSPADRAAAVSEMWKAAGRPLSGEVPPVQLALTAADDEILKALDGKYLTAVALAARTGLSERHIKRRIGEFLGPNGLVRNLPNSGYYRPDRPPPRRQDVTK